MGPGILASDGGSLATSEWSYPEFLLRLTLGLALGLLIGLERERRHTLETANRSEMEFVSCECSLDPVTEYILGSMAAILLCCYAAETREVKAKIFSRPKPIGRSI